MMDTNKEGIVSAPRKLIERLADHCKFWHDHPYLEAIQDLGAECALILAANPSSLTSSQSPVVGWEPAEWRTPVPLDGCSKPYDQGFSDGCSEAKLLNEQTVLRLQSEVRRLQGVEVLSFVTKSDIVKLKARTAELEGLLSRVVKSGALLLAPLEELEAECCAALNKTEVQSVETSHYEYRTDLQAWFGLSYASWLTIPRVLLEAMPSEWQKRMARLLHEYDEAIVNPPELSTTIRITANGKLVKTPEWLNNYRHPDRQMLDHVFGRAEKARDV